MRLKVDVVIPVGNHHKYLKSCISSVRNSHLIQSRIILVDNTPVGDTSLKQYLLGEDEYLRIEDRGYVQAVNGALTPNLLRNQFVTIMNSDDITGHHRMHNQISAMNHTGFEVSICPILKFKGVSILPNRFGNPKYENWNAAFLLFGFYGADASQIIRRETVLELEPRRIDIHPDLADFEYTLRLFSKNRVVSSFNDSHYYYRIHSNQMSRNRAKLKDYSKLDPVASSFFNSVFGLEISGAELYHFGPNSYDRIWTKEELNSQFKKVSSSLALSVNDPEVISQLRYLFARRMSSMSHPLIQGQQLLFEWLKLIRNEGPFIIQEQRYSA